MRICEANTRILRANSRLKTYEMCIEFQLAKPRINGSPAPRRIELCAGRGRKENALATQTGTRFPDGSPGGKRVPESALRLGRSFRMAPQAETATRNRAVEWDMLSQRQLKRKIHPGILVRNGMQFPNEWLAESSSRSPAFRTGRAFPAAVQAESASRNPASNWGTLSASPAASKNLRALHPKTG